MDTNTKVSWLQELLGARASWMLVCGQECAGPRGTEKPAAYDSLPLPSPSDSHTDFCFVVQSRFCKAWSGGLW